MPAPSVKVVAEKNAGGPFYMVPRKGRNSFIFKDNPQLNRILHNLTKMGLTDAQLAKALGMSKESLARALAKNPEIEAEVLAGRSEATRNVVETAYKMATGKTVSKVTKKRNNTEVTEYFPPSVAMIKFWLTNRDPANWKDKPSEQRRTREIISNEQTTGDDFARLCECLPETDTPGQKKEPGIPHETPPTVDFEPPGQKDVPGDVQGETADNVQDDVLDLPDQS